MAKARRRIVGELARFRGREEAGPFREGGGVLLDIGFDGMGGARGVAQRRARMGPADRERELVDDRVGDAAALGDAVERRALVEAAHMRDPFDHFA